MKNKTDRTEYEKTAELDRQNRQNRPARTGKAEWTGRAGKTECDWQNRKDRTEQSEQDFLCCTG
jgi:hypothetical protein